MFSNSYVHYYIYIARKVYADLRTPLMNVALRKCKQRKVAKQHDVEIRGNKMQNENRVRNVFFLVTRYLGMYDVYENPHKARAS